MLGFSDRKRKADVWRRVFIHLVLKIQPVNLSIATFYHFPQVGQTQVALKNNMAPCQGTYANWFIYANEEREPVDDFFLQVLSNIIKQQFNS